MTECDPRYCTYGNTTLSRDVAQNMRLRAVLNLVLQRCNDNGGEIDGELVGEIKGALEQQVTPKED